MANSIYNDIRNIFKSDQYLNQIMILNGLIFVVLNVLSVALPETTFDSVMGFMALSSDISNSFWKIWTPLTYMFTHLGLWHVVVNMFLLYMIGGILEDLYGRKQLALTYIFGGIFSGLFYLVVLLLMEGASSNHILIGASGGVMAVMIAIGILQPNYTVRLLLLGPVALKWVVLVSFILSSILDFNFNTGGKIAHIGGALYGLIYGYYLGKGININTSISNVFKPLSGIFSRRKKMKVVHKDTAFSGKSKEEQSKEVDVILEKIAKSGYDSLTKKEKDFLFKFGKE